MKKQQQEFIRYFRLAVGMSTIARKHGDIERAQGLDSTVKAYYKTSGSYDIDEDTLFEIETEIRNA
jgi:hypothetical protein